MRRRTLLTVGAAAGVILVVAGGSAIWLHPARRDARFTEAGRSIFAALAPAILSTLWPSDAREQAHATEAFLQRLEGTVDGLTPPLQAEVDELLSMLGSPAGRLILTGLRNPWAEASPAEVVAALQGLQVSPWRLRQQIFHALRDLTNAAYFASPATWSVIGYPGPRAI
jgi:hypothetical protein